ncbi:HAD family phosphatase [Octadecabacter sp. G9-8]|uniref:phosphoglycolate phosphatase n=1 Tax=Octadecabacter dasysiphoniae TaxID=2909341 RepID=A0ABS9CWW4_9RHOB|nr:HAD family phosphatase [Octadecabacter dasysiphoniae]MCF2871748.1 HAD family phosphatase [Octadecabacter dasysiphoniae]
MIPDLVVFDCDGVLVDTEGPTSIIIANSFTKYGVPMTAHEVDILFVGGTMEGVEAEGRKRGAAFPVDWQDEIYSEFFARFDEGIDVFDGVFTLLDALDARGIPHFIASNGPMKKMRSSLTPSGLWDRFGDRILSRENYAPKPDPAMIRHAIGRIGAAADKTFMIDDSVTGCRAGLNAGVHTIGFATEGQDAKLAEIGATVANSMADVQRIILD